MWLPASELFSNSVNHYMMHEVLSVLPSLMIRLSKGDGRGGEGRGEEGRG